MQSPQPGENAAQDIVIVGEPLAGGGEFAFMDDTVEEL